MSPYPATDLALSVQKQMLNGNGFSELLHCLSAQMFDMEVWADENDDDFIVLTDGNETPIGKFLPQYLFKGTGPVILA